MKKSCRMLSPILSILLTLPLTLSLLASCTGQQTPRHDLFDPPEIPPSKAPADWSVLEGSSPNPRNAENPASMRSTLFCFDGKGIKQWAFTPEEANTWVRMATRLSDGRFLIGVFRAGPEGDEATTLFEWRTGKKDDPAPANPTSIVDTIPGIVTQLVATGDGGCTVILRQTIGC